MIEMSLEEYQRKFADKPMVVAGAKARRGPTVDWEAELLSQIRLAGLPEPDRELVFHAVRKWRFDFSWKGHGRLVACEVDGGVYSGGRHTRGKGYEGDCEKLNEASLYGWLVLRVTPNMIKDGRALDWIERALL